MLRCPDFPTAALIWFFPTTCWSTYRRVILLLCWMRATAFLATRGSSCIALTAVITMLTSTVRSLRSTTLPIRIGIGPSGTIDFSIKIVFVRLTSSGSSKSLASRSCCLKIQPRAELMDLLPQMKIASEFSHYSAEELCCTSIGFVARKRRTELLAGSNKGPGSIRPED